MSTPPAVRREEPMMAAHPEPERGMPAHPEPGMPAHPVPERPTFPGYGISAAPEGLLPWDWAVARLTGSHNYWLATTNADGSPHLAAVWAVWFDGQLYFSTGARSRKGRNLAADPRCTLSPESAVESVVVRGVARPVTDPDERERLSRVYADKY